MPLNLVEKDVYQLVPSPDSNGYPATSEEKSLGVRSMSG
ncbi:hypothetical protein J2W57_001755 [Chryseobacterium ginsenosidimutans]|uniref:Uncharacterized protein n=1 Tax=Chryseobacterium geocarposphaerae TaxID=1416776 RepID=A0ABU1LBJ4_9FLAO|nr:hypothetical protein [Chryseobacterium geocarposphaerae]MDR6698383.1 hypothetical protein [Chryseobacterium ginsenosidimutans]